MDDRALLERAAKAAGEEYVNLLSHGKWNPLTYSGSALELAVRLRINVYNPPGKGASASIYIVDTDIVSYFNEEGSDAAATRLAITRAAAALEGDEREAGQ